MPHFNFAVLPSLQSGVWLEKCERRMLLETIQWTVRKAQHCFPGTLPNSFGCYTARHALIYSTAEHVSVQRFATKPKTENVAEVYENYIMLVQQNKKSAPEISLKGVKNVNDDQNGKFILTSLHCPSEHVVHFCYMMH